MLNMYLLALIFYNVCLTYHVCYTYCFETYRDYFNLTNINFNFMLYANDKCVLWTSLLQCLFIYGTGKHRHWYFNYSMALFAA